MAGNSNSAPTSLSRLATRFRALVVAPRQNKESGATARDMVRLTVQAASGQAANIIEVVDSSGVVLFSVGSAGALGAAPSVTATGLVTGSNIHTDTISISAADIIATGAGKLGHANGYTLVAAPGAGYVIELVSAVLSFTFGVAQYTAGGNITVNIGGGGAALTGLVSAANSLGNAASKIVSFLPLATAGNAITTNTGLSLVSSVAFTNPGTATGTVKVFVSYRIHAQ